MASTNASPTEVQVPVEQLGEFPLNLARALGQAGVGATQVRELFSRAAHSECPACGLRMSAQEITDLAVQPTEGAPVNPKQQRLRLGFCPRQGCDARFSIWKLSNEAGVDWSKILTGAERLETDEATQAQVVQAADTRAARRRRIKLQLQVLAGAILLVLIWKWFRDGAYIPGISPKPRTFIVEPSEGELPPPPTNTPRTFITR